LFTDFDAWGEDVRRSRRANQLIGGVFNAAVCRMRSEPPTACAWRCRSRLGEIPFALPKCAWNQLATPVLGRSAVEYTNGRVDTLTTHQLFDWFGPEEFDRLNRIAHQLDGLNLMLYFP
jgi:hypothetical protein